MLKVLMYLFENCQEGHARFVGDQEQLSGVLELAGFNPYDIRSALWWLDGFKQFDHEAKAFPAMSNRHCRFYDVDETAKISAKARALLSFLEQSNILSPHMRELAIDRAMAIDGFVDAPQMKWVLLITFFYHPGEKKSLEWMQELVLHGDVMH